jgi:hypothetical protein
MNPLRTTRSAGIVGIGCLLLVACIAVSGSAQAYYLGDTVLLSGYSYGSQTVYLFLTGPNLPPNGVALDNINARADEGHFTVVDVDSNNQWSYKWGTNAVGGKLDAGTYTVWVANGPNDRSHLSQADYSTISVPLGSPSISVLPGVSSTGVQTPVVPGTMTLNATPVTASVVVNGAYKGSTPLVISNLDPGTYSVMFSHFGYRKFTTPVKVVSGMTSEVTATLVVETGSLTVNTSPAGANLTLDGDTVGVSPVTLTNIVVGNHTLAVEKEGYTRAVVPVRVIVDQTTMTDIALTKAPVYPTLPVGMPPVFSAVLTACGACVARVLSSRSRSR